MASTTPVATRGGIDPRGPQLTAAVTAVVLVVALLLPPTAAAVVVALQAVLFLVGAVRGVQHSPAAWVFRTAVRPRLPAPSHLEDPRPPRFAQGVGLAFTIVALVGYASGHAVVAQVAVGAALVAALLNALFRFCLGCEMYLLLKRVTA
jgi:hypothetical protein